MPDGQLRHISWNSGGYEIRDSTGALIRKIKTNAYTFNVNFAKPVGRIIPLNSYDGVYLLDGVTGESILSKHEYIPHFMKAEGHHWLEAYLLPNASYLLLANGNSQSSSGVTYRIWDMKREEAVGDAVGGIRLEDDKGFPWLASSDNQWFMYQQEKGTENMEFLTLVDLPTTGREFTATVPLFSHGQSIAGTPVAKWLFEWSGDLPTDILDLAEAIAGCRVAEDGSYEWIDHPEECIGRLRIGLGEIRDKDLRCWAEWFLADRATRNIDPFRDLSVTSWSTTQLNRSYTNSCDRDNENDMTAFLHFILQHGSSREAQALSGETAAWLAANNGHDEMLALFWKQPVFDLTAIRTEVAAGKRSRIELIHASAAPQLRPLASRSSTMQQRGICIRRPWLPLPTPH